MKNKKIIFGIILLFAITGICNIKNVSAFTDTTYIPSLSYVWYNLGYLEQDEYIWIEEIDSDGSINVYIMNNEQLSTLLNSGGLIWNYIKKWQDTVYLGNWKIDITEDEYYYIVLYNKALLTGRTVYIDVSVRNVIFTPTQDWTFFVWLLALGIPAIISIVIIVIVVKKHKNKKLKELIEQEVKRQEAPKIIYCSECGAEIDKERAFCSKCGTKI